MADNAAALGFSKGFGRTVTPVARPSATKLRAVAEVIECQTKAPLEVVHGEARVALPRELVQLLAQAVTAFESGDNVALVADKGDAAAIISSQAAADLLNVSRPHVVKLAREGRLPSVQVGNRYRFRLGDVVSFAEAEAGRRDELLAQLAPEGGYEPGDF